MNDKNTAQFEPGEIVHHPKKGRGYVLSYGTDWPGRIRIIYTDSRSACGYKIDIFNFDDWKRVEVAKPGHVQVRLPLLHRRR